MVIYTSIEKNLENVTFFELNRWRHTFFTTRFNFSEFCGGKISKRTSKLS